jgi:hypothetical protein
MARRSSDIDLREHVNYFSWPVFIEWWEWKKAQSVSVVGAIGSGKSTLITAILPKQPSVVFFATKPRDPIYTQLEQQGYRRLTSWPRATIIERHPDPGPRILLWPELRNLKEDVARQKRVFGDALERIFTDAQEPGHGRVVVVDETRYLIQSLGLARSFLTVLLQGRALDVPVVSGAQRAAWVPREVWSEVTHVFIFGTRDRRDLMSLRELGGKVDPEIVTEAVLSLKEHEVLYLNRVSGRAAITKAPKAT